jgi:ABC-type sugar transport system permease subunit
LKRASLEGQKAMAGRFFVYPWVVGMLLFFAKPLVESVIYSFQELEITDKGLVSTFVGTKNYVYAFTRDPAFMDTLLRTISTIIVDLPLVVLFSLFAAVMLNQEFRGRGLVRSAFFLPVIITSGALVYVLKSDMTSAQVNTEAVKSAMPMVQNLDFKQMMLQVTNNIRFVQPLIDVMDRVFIIIWKSGVQILIFLAGLQSISSDLYEAANVEGATGWESFWKITFPMISPIIVVNVVYTIIDSFTDYNNEMLLYILNTAFAKIQYAYSSTIAWVYFVIVFGVLLAAVGLLSRKIFYMND